MGKRINQTSLYTFTDDMAGTLRYRLDFEPAYDDVYLRNHIEVNAPDGSRGLSGSGVAIDATSTADYGILVHSIASQLENPSERQALAEYHALRYAQPELRLPALPLEGASNPAALWPAILDLEISDPITVKRFAGTAAEMTLELNVEGIRHSCKPGGPWTTKIATSPRDTRTYMVADHATLGKADSGNLASP